MKLVKTIAFLFLIIGSVQSYAQFKLSGKINPYNGKEEVEINIPVVFGYHKHNAITIPIAKDGSFSLILPIKEVKFAMVVFQNKRNILLLHPNKNLTIQLNATDGSLKFIAGTALPENNLMQAVGFRETPFFLNDDGSMFNKLFLAQLLEKVVRPFFITQEEKIKKVQTAQISVKDKLLIASEIKYRTYYLLDMYARTAGLRKSTMDSLILEIFDKCKLVPQVYPAGPNYYDFIDSYLRYLETKAFIKIQEDKIPSNQPIPYFGISLDSATVAIKRYGKPYWLWLGSIKNLPLKAVEPYIYQQITTLFNEKDLAHLSPLATAFKQQFPNSIYLNEVNTKVASLNTMLLKNAFNANIKIAEGYEKMTSISDIIKQLKGKVVYLDVWGTWCGPCKEELAFIPELKARFKDKDVAYIYLDLDDDSLDPKWRDFIITNNMEGFHLRKTRQTIAPFWKELLANADDKTEYYPQYFIFDKTGKLVVSKAKRPSDKGELYKQIEQFLK